MNEFEVDYYDFTVCPFSPEHKISRDEYLNHITSCEDRHDMNKLINLHQCPHNKSHCFSNSFSLSYHIPRCQDHANRVKSFSTAGQTNIEYKKCLFNSLHMIRAGNTVWYKNHIDNCPNKENKAEITLQTTEKPSGQLNPRKILQPSSNIALSFSTPPKAVLEKIQIHFAGRTFSVLKKDLGQGVEESEIFIGHTTFPDVREWPGLKLIEDSKAHNDFLVGHLQAYYEPGSQAAFKQFLGFLTMTSKNRCTIAVSTQATSIKNRLILVVHRTDESGFGACLQDADLGVFYIEHSRLYSCDSLFRDSELRLSEKETLCQKLQLRIDNSEKLQICLTDVFNELKLNNCSVNADHKILDKCLEDHIEELKQRNENYRLECMSIIEQAKRNGEHENAIFCRLIETANVEKTNLELSILDKNKQSDVEINDESRKYEWLKQQIEESKHEKQVLENRGVEVGIKLKRLMSGKATRQELIEIVKEEAVRGIEANLMQKYVCRLCRNAEIDVLFLPCGHCELCKRCAGVAGLEITGNVVDVNNISRCGKCGRLVEQVTKVLP